MSFNLESRYRLSPGFAAVVFYDGGFIDDYFHGYLMLYSRLWNWCPFLKTIIPIRIDLAKGNNEAMFHFNLSQTF